MRRATWRRCVSGRCSGVRESSSQPLTPKGTAPLLHCQTRAKRVRRFTEHARDRPVWQCRLRDTPTSRGPGRPRIDDRPGPVRRPRGHAPHACRGTLRAPCRPERRPRRPRGRSTPGTVPPAPAEPAARPTTDAVRRTAFRRLPAPVPLPRPGRLRGRRRGRRARPGRRHRDLPDHAAPVRPPGLPRGVRFRTPSDPSPGPPVRAPVRRPVRLRGRTGVTAPQG